MSQHIYFAVHNEKSSYEVSRLNPLEATRPWRFKTAMLKRGNEKVSSRSPRQKGNPNTERGVAAFEADELKASDPAMEKVLRVAMPSRVQTNRTFQYRVHAGGTPVRGVGVRVLAYQTRETFRLEIPWACPIGGYQSDSRHGQLDG